MFAYYRRLIAVLVRVLVFHFALAVNTCPLTGDNHLLQVLFVVFPVRIEDTRHARHRQQHRVRLHQTGLHLRLQRVTATAELIPVIGTQEPIVTLHERHRITTITATHDTVAAALAVVPTRYRIEYMPFQVKVQTHQVVFRILNTRPDIIRTLVALHECNLRTGMFVVVPVMPVVESVTFVITETVVFHHVAHP